MSERRDFIRGGGGFVRITIVTSTHRPACQWLTIHRSFQRSGTGFRHAPCNYLSPYWRKYQWQTIVVSCTAKFHTLINRVRSLNASEQRRGTQTPPMYSFTAKEGGAVSSAIQKLALVLAAGNLCRLVSLQHGKKSGQSTAVFPLGCKPARQQQRGTLSARKHAQTELQVDKIYTSNRYQPRAGPQPLGSRSRKTGVLLAVHVSKCDLQHMQSFMLWQ